MHAIRAICWALIGTIVTAPAAQGQSGYLSVWRVAPGRQAEPQQWVKPSTTFARATLVPAKMVVLKAPVPDLTGRGAIPAGTELIRLASQQVIACTTKPVVQKFFLSTPYSPMRHLCFADTAASARFDRIFELPGKTLFLFGRGVLPDVMTPISPIPYESADPTTSQTTIPIFLRYKNFASFVDKLIFEICFKEKYARPQECLQPDIAVRRSTIPTEFEVLGGRFRIDAKDGNRLAITMTKQFDTDPLLIQPPRR
jgi:hypothetical protein